MFELLLDQGESMWNARDIREVSFTTILFLVCRVEHRDSVGLPILSVCRCRHSSPSRPAPPQCSQQSKLVLNFHLRPTKLLCAILRLPCTAICHASMLSGVGGDWSSIFHDCELTTSMFHQSMRLRQPFCSVNCKFEKTKKSFF